MVSPGATRLSEERCREPSCIFNAGENDSVFSRELNKRFTNLIPTTFLLFNSLVFNIRNLP